MNKKALTAMVKTAHDANAPKDQLEQFLKHQYVPLPWQWEFHGIARAADLPDGPLDIGLGGARGPGYYGTSSDR